MDHFGRVRAHRLVLVAGCAAVTTFSAGCIDTGRIDKIAVKPHRVTSFEDAASVHIAVLSNTPFELLRAELQPKFPMDEAKAVEEVIPNTQLLVERALDVVERSLRLTTPLTSTSSTVTTHSKTGAASTRTSDRTDTKAPGELPGEASFPGGDRTAGALTAATPAAPAERAIDPFAKYKAAAALMQEIKLLNQYVVAQQIPKDSVAQVVRLQISVLPYARNEPYDVYTNISFFPEGKAPGNRQAAKLLNFEEPGKGVALVIPLLATDNFEASSQSSAAEAVQQAAFSLLGLIKGLGLGADYGRMLDQVRAVTGRELNALTTTARLTNNTLRVRLGAPFSNRAGYAMVPQTYNVSAVVVLPKDTARVDIVARSEIRDATEGTVLNNRDRAETARLACERLARYPNLPNNPLQGRVEWSKPEKFCAKLPPEEGPEECDKAKNLRTQILCLVQDVEFGRFPEFRIKLANDQAQYNDTITALWAGFADQLSGSHYSRAWFAIEETRRVWPPSQTVVANDDGKTVTLAIANGRDLPPNVISASLSLPLKAPEPKSKKGPPPPAPPNLELKASSVQVEAFNTLKLGFPSPQLMGETVDTKQTAKLSLTNESGVEVLHAWPGDAQAASVVKDWKLDVVVQAKKPEPETKPTFAFTVNAIAVDAKGNASVQLQVRDANLAAKEGAGDLYLKFLGGDLIEYLPATALAETPKGLQLKQAVPIKLTFNNVRDSTNMVFMLLGKDAKPKIDEVRLDVWALAPPKSAANVKEGS